MEFSCITPIQELFFVQPLGLRFITRNIKRTCRDLYYYMRHRLIIYEKNTKYSRYEL